MCIAIRAELFVCGEVNDVNAYMNEVVSVGVLDELRGSANFLKNIYIDSSDESKNFGDRVTIAAPIDLGPAKVFDPAVGSSPTPIVAQGVPIDLNIHLYQEVCMSDVQAMNHNRKGTIPQALKAAITSVVESTNLYAISFYKGVSQHSGDLESIAKRDKDDILAGRAVLQKNKVLRDYRLVTGINTELALLKDFSNLSESGDQTLINEAIMGRKFGINISTDQQIEKHISGSAAQADGIVTSANPLVGVSFLRLESVPVGATFNHGDIVKVAGGFSYSVATNQVVTETGAIELLINEKLIAPIVAGTAVEVVGDHNVDILMTQNAIGAATRQIETQEDSNVMTTFVTDPLTGWNFRLQRWTTPKTSQTHWRFETLFGMSLLDPKRIVRMGGH
ncbi:hypothetical protein ACJRW5_05150 [Pseudomonas sp. SH1-B]